MKINREDGILKVMIIAFPLIVFGNAIEYFAVDKDDLKKIYGKVSQVIHKTYKCPKGFRGRYSGVGLCEKTIIKLENVKGNFHVSDYADRGEYIEGKVMM